MTEYAFPELICPACQTALVLADNSYNCSQCQQSYSVRDDIPRFVAQQHLASFGLQWNKYDVAHKDEDQQTFSAKTGVELGDLQGLQVLDAGCGGGRYSKVCGELGAIVTGVDQSAAVDKARRLCAHLPNVRTIQADLKQLPLPQQTFDLVFSIGVMHHDTNTKSVFDAVAPLVRSGGRLSVWLYRRNQWWQEAINNALRHKTTAMEPEKLEKWCRRGARLGGVPIINRTLNKIVNFSAHPDFQNRICDTFDWYAPQFQHHHTASELCAWFRDAGFDTLNVLPPEKTGRVYRWCYERGLLIGSGVNVTGIRC